MGAESFILIGGIVFVLWYLWKDRLQADVDGEPFEQREVVPEPEPVEQREVVSEPEPAEPEPTVEEISPETITEVLEIASLNGNVPQESIAEPDEPESENGIETDSENKVKLEAEPAPIEISESDVMTQNSEDIKVEISSSDESLTTTAASLVTDPIEFAFPVSQVNEKRSLLLKNDTDKFILAKSMITNPGVEIEPEYTVIKPNSTSDWLVTLLGRANLETNPVEILLFCIPLIHQPGGPTDFCIDPNNNSQTLGYILNRKVDWSSKECSFDIGKSPYLTLNRALELRRWLKPGSERNYDFAHSLQVVRRKDGKNLPEHILTLPGNASMDGNLESVPLTTSYTNVQNERASSEDEKSGVKKEIPHIELTNKRMLNEWVDFQIGEAFPDRRPVRALFRELDTFEDENANQFVALLYHHGEPVMGRAWNQDGKVAASFSWEGHDLRNGCIKGLIQILFELDTSLRGFDYDWRPFVEAASFEKDKDWHPVHVNYVNRVDVSPGVIFADGKEILGKVDIVNEKASYGWRQAEHTVVGPPVHSFLVLCRKARIGCKFD